MPRLKFSLLFRDLFEFGGYKLGDSDGDVDGITVVLDHSRATANCPICGRRCSSIGDTYTRRIRDLDLGTKQCFLLFIERRGRYDAVAAIVALRSGASWTSTASTRNKRFEDYLSTLCAKMTLTDAASVAGIDGKAAKRIDTKYLSQLATGLDDLNQKRLGIDKIAYEKGHLQACGGNPKTGDVPELLT